MQEMREMWSQNELEENRSDIRADNEKERGEEVERRREKKERLKERLEGLGVYKGDKELGWFVDKFEKIMRDHEVN